MTGKLDDWINAQQIYPNEWLKGNDPDRERPLNFNYPQELQTDYMSTYDVEYSNHTDKGGDILLTCMWRTVSRRTERIGPAILDSK